MPIGAMGTAGQQVFRLVRRLRDELSVNTTCGASNVSFGLPSRNHITGTFLAMAIGAGMTSAIMNPLHPEVKQMVMAADVLAGNDEHCAAWIRVNRDPGVEGDRARGARRRGGRAARREESGAVTELVDQVSFEVVPLKNLEAQLSLLPAGSKVSVTCSPVKGVDVTMSWATRLQERGLPATPARLRSDGPGSHPPGRSGGRVGRRRAE